MTGIASIIVRMYRNLLGDCFLIRVQEEGGIERRILIDCGILQGLGATEGKRPSGQDRIRAVAQHIVETCSTGGGDKPAGCDAFIDLLVVTHQHFDHVGGFIQAKDILFDAKLAFGELWMGWTEDPDDKDAKAINARLDSRKTALVKLVAGLGNGNGASALAEGTPDDGRSLAPLRDELAAYAGFIGPIEDDGLGLDGAPRLTMSRIFDAIKQKAGKIRYCSPGEIVQTPGAAPLTVAVLGPPRDWALLSKDLPTPSAKETYLAGPAPSDAPPVKAWNSPPAVQSLSHWFLPAADEVPAKGDAADLARSSPFAHRYWAGTSMAAVLAAGDATPEARTQTDAGWLYDRYYFVPAGAPAKPEDVPDRKVPDPRDQRFRRIDGAWTEAASSLALDLDSDTNNTSLVLAFQLPDDEGSFMLFAADAQVGNWLSWHNQTYAIGTAPPLTAADILNRTRLYKVGHHGSHNATLRGKGLELMTHADLAAMCSTVEEEAAGKKGWQMPNPDVKTQLIAHCDGRLLRGDRAWADDPDTAPYQSQAASFASRISYGPVVNGEPIYVELQMI
ncbi:MBL fold metallo-hydrolase [Sphingomonas nostoxanthinifaciens]|uniref:MBL fold metallo-hydrolase n=1 Tax=Sphingomonas nostoxanthinifaciens TaxID=2872652 RepID=UPI001CC21924|nr:MBL fold metallo-hydrolase [Sphingomonas nostoxanthinifaciens]UAK26326.1 hypothetical protein K8P63_09680 [Sphingomonas nostoxanthinifaciens]